MIQCNATERIFAPLKNLKCFQDYLTKDMCCASDRGNDAVQRTHMNRLSLFSNSENKK
jgi:hypothetical protein